MRQSSSTLLLVVATLLSSIQVSDGAFSFLNLFNQFCSILVTQLPVKPGCGCNVKYSSSYGINFNVACELDEPICLANNLCATPAINGKYYRRAINSTTFLSFNLTDSGEFLGLTLKPLKFNFTHTAPIIFTKPIDFASCSITYGTSKCKTCTICGNGMGFLFDCSNIKIGLIPLPKSDNCITIPGTNTTSRRTSSSKLP